VSPLNSRTTYKDVANSFSIFGGILFTPIPLTAVACYGAGPLNVRPSFRSQNVPPLLHKPLHKPRYRCGQFITAQFWHCLLWLSLALEFTVVWNIKTVLRSKNKFLDQKGCQWHTVPI